MIQMSKAANETQSFFKTELHQLNRAKQFQKLKIFNLEVTK